MRFCLVDRVLSVVPGESIETVKQVSLAEEYLQDHFPGFAVFPGVLMVEWGLRRGAPSEARCVAISALMSAIGVGAMWVLSSYGGFGEDALSWWWSLLVLPFPIGWLRGLYNLGRWIGEGRDAPR